MKASQTATIGTIAGAAGVTVETVRFYESKGLLKKAQRNASGYRQYSDEDARRVRFIKRAQELGFTLREVKQLLDLRATTKARCGDVKKKTDAKLEEIESRIRDLQKMRRALRRLSDSCACEEISTECTVIDCFEGRD